uniref:Minor tail protein n=1 Tax=Phage sp. cty4N14 TaxID=2825799 RepID=A0A8S5U4Q4_9VIRU|nr:MAG TPA: minor tail protein [Phage sp. cty4N14]
MAETAGIAGATEDEYKQLQAAAQEMGKRTTKTATEAAQALGYMSLAGWNVNDSISALEPVLRLSEATSMDLATCSDLVTDSMSALGLGVDDLTNYLNVAVQANNKSNTTAQALMEAMIGCGGAAKSAGMDYKQTAAALGILANNGIKGAEAGTALNSMLVRMTTKDVAQKAFKELGVSIYDSSGAMRNMQDILVELNGAMSGLSQEQKNNYMAAIAGTNYYTQFGYLLEGVAEGADGAASTWTQLTEAFDNSDGALDAMANTMTDTLPGAMAIFGSAVDDAKIRLCEVFAPLAKDAIKGVADVIPSITDRAVGVAQSFYNTVVPAAENFAKKAIAAFNQAKPAFDEIRTKATDAFIFLRDTGITAFENIKAKIEENKPAIDKVIAVALDLKDKLFQAWEIVKPAISQIATVAIPAVIGAMMKVIGAAATVYQKLDEWGLLIPIITGIAGAVATVKMVEFAKDTMNTVKAVKALVVVFGAEKKAMIVNLALKAKDRLETAYLYALYAKDAVVKGISTAATWAQTAALTAWNAICAVGTAVTSALGVAFAFLTSPIGLVCVAIAAVIAIGVLLYKNWDTVKEKASQLGDWIVGVFNNLKEKASAAIQEFADKFPVAFAFLSSVFESWKQTITNIFSGVKQVFQGVVQFISGVFTGDWSKALDGLKNIFSGAFRALSLLALAPLNALKGAVVGAFNAIDTATGGKLSVIKNKVSDAFSSIKKTAGSIMQAAKDTISEKLSNIKSAYEEHGGGIKGIAAAAIEGVKGYYTAGYTFIDKLTGGKLTAIKEKFSKIWSQISEKVSEAWTTIKNIVKVGVMLIGEIISAAFQIITLPFQFIWQNCKDTILSAWEFIKTTVSDGIQKVKDTISSFLSPIVNAVSGAWSSVKSATGSAWSAVKSATSSAWTAVSSATNTAWTAASGYISNKINAAKATVSSVTSSIRSTASAAWSAVSSATNSAWTTTTGYISNKINAAKATVSLVTSSIRSTASAAWSAVSSATSSAFENVRATMSNKINTAKANVSSALSGIRSAFSSGLSAAKNTVTSIFGNIVSAISGKMESAKNAVSNAIGALKSKFNFSWSLPKLKLPHVSISGGFSINPPSVPHFGISWYKNGGILNKPTIFGASGNNLLGGGEAGKEAVLPLAELWSNMKSIVAGVVQGNQNDGAASVFDRMKQLVGIQSNGQPAESVTKQLYNNVTTSNTTNRTKEDNSSTDSSKFVYSPSVVIQGNASKEDVNEALEMSQQKFNEMMDRWKKGKERTSFA